MVEKALYYQTYPLGIISVSRLSAIIALAIGLFATYFIYPPWVMIIYGIAYLLTFIYNTKYRAVMCDYYGKTIHSSIGKYAQNFPPRGDVTSFKHQNAALITISIASYLMIILPPLLWGFILLYDQTFWNAALLLFIVYLIAIIYPTYVLRKKIMPALCET